MTDPIPDVARGWLALAEIAEGDSIKIGRKTLIAGCRALIARTEALNEIAAWGQGKSVTGSFDEPCSAAIARAALADSLVRDRG